MQSYLTLEDIAHTTTRVESLHDELKDTQGKRLIKSEMLTVHQLMWEKEISAKGEYFDYTMIFTNIFIWKGKITLFNMDKHMMDYLYPITFQRA